MSEIIVSSSGDSDERKIDEYHDESSFSGSSSSDSSSSSGGNTTNEQYLFGVPEVPLEVLQKEMRMRMAFGSFAGASTSALSSTSSSEEETLYCCAVGIPSRMDEKNLIPLEVGTRSLMTLTLV